MKWTNISSDIFLTYLLIFFLAYLVTLFLTYLLTFFRTFLLTFFVLGCLSIILSASSTTTSSSSWRSSPDKDPPSAGIHGGTHPIWVPLVRHKVFACRQGGRHDDWKQEKGGEREREKERQKEREKERERERKRDKERKRKAERERNRQRRRERERGKKERERKKTKTEKEKGRERQRQKERDRQTKRETDTERERERRRQTTNPATTKKKGGPISVARGLRCYHFKADTVWLGFLTFAMHRHRKFQPEGLWFPEVHGVTPATGELNMLKVFM